ncbi:MAG TPA: hypothetical protein VN428_10545 [Bryobacteraceae bacterium]|nr:hypothetical protein [Bryobacteraceae bacterium]
MITNPTFKAVLAGMAGGMVGAWAINRFYDLARESSRTESTWPYILGAGMGASYATFVHRRDVPLYARVPLGAAVWLGDPEKTAAPPKGGHGVTEKARNAGLRFASKRLKRVAEKALFA